MIERILNLYKQLDDDERREMEKIILELSKIRHSTYISRLKGSSSFDEKIYEFLQREKIKNVGLPEKFRYYFPADPTEELFIASEFVALNLREEEHNFADEEYSKILQALTLNFALKIIIDSFCWENIRKFLHLFRLSKYILGDRRCNERE